MSFSKAILDAGHKMASRKALRAVPVLGIVVGAAYAYRTIRNKGVARGSADSLLDLTPVVGRVKAVVELFTGDLIPAKRQLADETEV